MAKIGVIGLGAMGYPIAEHVLEGSNELYVTFHTDKRPAQSLVSKGAVLCRTPMEAAGFCEMILLVLPDSPQVEEVLFSDQGIAAVPAKNITVIDMSTIDLVKSQEFASRAASSGITYLDAPISGGPQGAKDASLSIMVGGDKEAFLASQALLNTLGKTVVHCGKNGMGLAAKMANNLIAAAQMTAISEAVTLAVKAGIDPEVLFTILSNSTADSRILRAKFPLFLSDDYTPGLKLSLMCKDLDIITTAAKRLGTPTIVGSAVEQVFRICKESYGDKDSSAVCKFYQKYGSVSFQPPVE